MNDIFQKNKPKIIRNGIKLAIFNAIFLFAKITGVTLLSAISIAILLAFIAAAVYVKLKNFAGVEGQADFLKNGQLIPPEKLKRYYESLYIELNNLVQTFRKAALLTDPVFTAKILAVLFVTSHAAWQLGDFGFAWLGGNSYLIYPIILIFFGPQIRGGIKKAEDMIQSALKKQKKD